MAETHAQTWRGGIARRNALFSSVYILSALMSLLALTPAFSVLEKYNPSRNSYRLTPALWLATQINSWLLSAVYIVNCFNSFRQYHAYLADAPQEVIPFLISYATVGNYFVLALGCLFVLEFSFVMWYFSRTVQLKNDTMRNKCSFWFKTLAQSFGLTGIVFFLQCIGGYSVFFFILFLASPLVAIYTLLAHVITSVFLTFPIALLIYPCTARNVGKKCFQGCGLLLYIILGTLCLMGFTGIFLATVVDNLTAPLNSNQIATSIMSSGLLALMAYIVKKTLWHHLWQPNIVETDDEETPLLH